MWVPHTHTHPNQHPHKLANTTPEKKLALKARLCGVIIVTLDVAKMSINNVDLSIPILQVLKVYAHNSSNAASLVKHGAINYVDR